MKELQNVSLKDYSTMRLGGTAKYVAEVTNKEELQTALSWADEQSLPAIMIGDGSNIVWRDEGFNGLLIVSKIKRYEVIEREDGDVFVTVGSGENWDSVVERSVKSGFTGIEALSWIPGTAGATPVQNVGAYGQEIAEVFVSAEVYDRQTKSIIFLSKYDLEFGYRTSRLKTVDHGRFFIAAITLHLRKGNPEPPFYQVLERYLKERGIQEFTPQVIRDAVIKIRSSKLPDPKEVANNGSFFSNPVVDEGTLVQIQGTYPDVVFWRLDGGRGIKLSAAWLIEKVGFKDFHDPETGMATWAKQPLVLVNEKATSSQQLLVFKQKIVDTVKKKFEVTLKQEPEILPDIKETVGPAEATKTTESDLDLSTLNPT
jgi:UDP-N-acetylmuramate dehydrogenase